MANDSLLRGITVINQIEREESKNCGTVPYVTVIGPDKLVTPQVTLCAILFNFRVFNAIPGIHQLMKLLVRLFMSTYSIRIHDQAHMLPRPSDRHITPPQFPQKANLLLIIGPHKGVNYGVLLPSLEAINGANLYYCAVQLLLLHDPIP